MYPALVTIHEILICLNLDSFAQHLMLLFYLPITQYTFKLFRPLLRHVSMFRLCTSKGVQKHAGSCMDPGRVS